MVSRSTSWTFSKTSWCSLAYSAIGLVKIVTLKTRNSALSVGISSLSLTWWQKKASVKQHAALASLLTGPNPKSVRSVIPHATDVRTMVKRETRRDAFLALKVSPWESLILSTVQTSATMDYLLPQSQRVVDAKLLVRIVLTLRVPVLLATRKSLDCGTSSASRCVPRASSSSRANASLAILPALLVTKRLTSVQTAMGLTTPVSCLKVNATRTAQLERFWVKPTRSLAWTVRQLSAIYAMQVTWKGALFASPSIKLTTKGSVKGYILMMIVWWLDVRHVLTKRWKSVWSVKITSCWLTANVLMIVAVQLTFWRLVLA